MSSQSAGSVQGRQPDDVRSSEQGFVGERRIVSEHSAGKNDRFARARQPAQR